MRNRFERQPAFAALLSGALACAAIALTTPVVSAADAPVKPPKPAPVVAETPAGTGTGETKPTADAVVIGGTQVPPITRNFYTGGDVWTYTPDLKAREPFSYARSMKAARLPDNTRPGTDNVQTVQQDKVFVAGLPRDYANALDQFQAAMDALSQSETRTRDANLETAKSQLNGCLANLDTIRSQAAKFEKTTMEPENRKVFDYYYAASNRLQRAARQQYDWVLLQIRFSNEVLKPEKYAITAIEAHRENPTWAYSAVLFHGLKDPVHVDETFPKPEPGKVPDLEMKIVSLTPSTVTVLFQHQATFEIPVIREAKPAGETTGAKK